MFKRRSSASVQEVEALSDLAAIGLPRRRLLIGAMRKLILLVFLLGLFVDLAGLPHVRLSYEYQGSVDGPVITRATYWSIIGTRVIDRGEMGGGAMPLIALVPLKKSIFEHLRELVCEELSRGRNDLAKAE